MDENRYCTICWSQLLLSVACNPMWWCYAWFKQPDTVSDNGVLGGLGWLNPEVRCLGLVPQLTLSKISSTAETILCSLQPGFRKTRCPTQPLKLLIFQTTYSLRNSKNEKLVAKPRFAGGSNPRQSTVYIDIYPKNQWGSQLYGTCMHRMVLWEFCPYQLLLYAY